MKRKKKDGSQTNISCQVAVKNYNCLMGGVDVADAKRKVYSCSRRSKKWLHRPFYFIVDVCIVNAFIIQSASRFSEKMIQKNFRLEPARELLACQSSRSNVREVEHSLMVILQLCSMSNTSLRNYLLQGSESLLKNNGT